MSIVSPVLPDSLPKTRMRFPRSLLISICLLALSACSLGPDYVRPDTPAPTAWRTDTKPEAVNPWPNADWWRGFEAPVLDDLIAQAMDNNNDLAGAIARIREADAQAQIAGAALLPSVKAAGIASRGHQSTSQGMKTSSTFSPVLSASYELDFWGKYAATQESALAAATASRFDRVTVELGVVSGVAASYFQALALFDRLDVAESNLSNARQTLQALQKQQTAGIVTALDVAQQKTAVANLEAAVPPLRQQRDQTINALAILTGRLPQSLLVQKNSLDDLHAINVVAGLPSELLTRRPDVANAEARLISANANIKVARAAFFPDIALTANGGYINSALSTLFSPGSRIWAIGANLTQPIFAGGALEGQLAYSQARYDELLSSYRNTVISAFGNVEDALSAVQQTSEQQVFRQQAVAEAQRAYGFAQKQMQAGTINILTLLNTQNALFSARDALVQTRLAHFQALVSLYKALGGGWQNDQAAAS